jgi:N-acetylmuramoyl-L-alanine amidase
MSKFLKITVPLLLLLFLASAIYLRGLLDQAKKIPPRKSKQTQQFSALASPPDWKLLEPYQNTITRADFERLLTQIYTTGNGWRNFIAIDDQSARITANGDDVFQLNFATTERAAKVPRHWRSTAEIPAGTPQKPLDGVKIAIDPGHIGGEWAQIEERWFVVGNGTPVSEGEMTLKVAKLLKPKLEALGASVSLVRDRLEPITTKRPESLADLAKSSIGPNDAPEAIQRTAERLFYRTAEIHDRADLVNTRLKPDLVLCLHFNAEAWGNPNQPTLVNKNHLHLILNGGYTDEEVSLADQRFEMLKRLLQHTHEEEVLVGSTVAETFAKMSGLPPYNYQFTNNFRAIDGQPYLWARNLLANRLYNCPVIFMEPYVMNSTTDYNRIQAGDYEGLREIDGKMQPSIFREYAGALAKGLENHYSQPRN